MKKLWETFWAHQVWKNTSTGEVWICDHRGRAKSCPECTKPFRLLTTRNYTSFRGRAVIFTAIMIVAVAVMMMALRKH
jgi:hypothetical protein